jgi:hypothetical protein
VTVESYNTTIQSIRQQVSAYSQPSSGFIFSGERERGEKKNSSPQEQDLIFLQKSL